MRHTISRRLWGALAIAALSASAPVAQSGSQPPPQPSQQPPFRIETNFVRVDAYPMKDGKPLQGLTAADFEVREDGVLQEIKAFEHVLITPAGPQADRREPSSQRDMLHEAANPRSRVFVIFLDTMNVTVTGSHHIAEPIIRLIDRIVGPDDLVGIFAPHMSTSNLVLARKTQVVEESLRKNWAWGLRYSLMRDEHETAYERCYPPVEPNEYMFSELSKKMIARKRERATFEALQDLVRYLQAVREERKAIITVTEGWARYRPDAEMMRLRENKAADYQEPIPGPEIISVGPTGKLGTRDSRTLHPDTLTKRECDTDRMRLSMLDNDQFFRDLVDDANRANASFYPVDPRGLPVFDAPIGPDAPPPVSIDAANLRHRLESLHDLALGTDGMAIVNNNNLDTGLRRIADDLTSYYLLGYYSTNTKLDGRFRRIQVRVKQPGVDVRARRGYRAATAEEVEAARAAAEKPAGPSTAFTAAMGSLARIRPEARFRINAAALVEGNAGTVWVAGELASRSTPSDEFALGGTADIEVKAGEASSTARVKLAPGERGFVVPVKLDVGDAPRVEVRARLSGEGTAVPFTDAIDAPLGAGVAQPLVFRRGPTTGNRVVPAADFRFSRTERLRLEVPIASETKPGEGRVLDKTGQPLAIPVKVGERTDDATGQRWLTADLMLAPLAAGDYAIELSATTGAGTQQIVTAIRVTR